ncbi:cell division protein FtsX [Campylobacter lanienae]|uniref:cell division protein FtsX n=1 Tax=Campylobacter lanienae TaxID=75658 RepID=UPI00242B0380|nr:cell division protein FtsX [Campylobacter lanienae]MCI5539847.1 cell division protein FtsX [Campylobacter lanienae]MDD7514159.1 cell division protein FtsX [Campylobacter lanienae]MDY5519721.1 cell division protein FtsX [Campylobacter lanienae]MDY6134145.1 cell division protein FtsX [Campylobacter lanienae]
MRSFKSHISVIFPLVILLFAIEFSLMLGKFVSDYEFKMTSDYNIIIVSEIELNENMLIPIIPTFASLTTLDANLILNRLKNDISAKNISVLKSILPKFYSLKLTNFPSKDAMVNIKANLSKIQGIKRVETFSKTHDQVYNMLILSKNIAEYFAILVGLLGLVLVFKQMRIWLYEHKRRVEIMTLFGAPYWLKSAMLYKLSIIDSIIATTLVVIFYAIFPALPSFKSAIFAVGFDQPNLNLLSDATILFGVSIGVSVIAVSLVMLLSRRR